MHQYSQDPYTIRKWYSFVEEITCDDSTEPDALKKPAKRAIVAAAIVNPYAGRSSDSLEAIFAHLPTLGTTFGLKLLQALAPFKPQSYGKAALVGSLGEFEHGKAFLTTEMVNSIRSLFDNAKAWVPSVCKRASIQQTITVPLACKDALNVVSHEDCIPVSFPDAPRPNEVVVIFAASSGGRPNARLHGLQYADISQNDGLR